LATESSDHLTEILVTLSENDIDFIVCGGVALVLQGVERLTMDIDLSVDLNENNLRKFLTAMNRLGLKPRAPVPAESLLDPAARRIFVEEKNALVFTFHDPETPFRQVDFFIADSLCFDALKHDAEVIAIGNHPIKVLTRSKLLELKLAVSPPREKDLFDIQILRKLLEKERARE
jgi:hypothetical protein